MVPVLDALRVEVQQALQGAALRPSVPTFEVADGGFRYAAHLDYLHLGKSSTSAQLLEPGASVLFCRSHDFHPNLAPTLIWCKWKLCIVIDFTT